MAGIYHDGETQRQPPAVLESWIRDLQKDAGEAQVGRIAELCSRMDTGRTEWNAAALAQHISALHSAGRELHFDRLRPGWLRRVTGRYKREHERFIAAHARFVSGTTRLKAEAAELGNSFKGRATATRRILVELDMEWNALQGEVDQGVNWLQDLCFQLSEDHTRGDDDPGVMSLAEKAQGFTQQFKRMQSLVSLSREIGVRGQALLERQAALLERVRADIGYLDKDWARPLGRLVADLKAGRTAPAGVPAAIEAHDHLMKRLATSADACAALQSEEHLMAQHLQMLRETLETRR